MRGPSWFVGCITVFSALATACGSDAVEVEDSEPASRAASWSLICVDEDGDGFGPHCGTGSDCDDGDAAMHADCAECKTPDEGCDCVPGTEAVSCTLERSVTQEGSLLCLSGVRYCRDGAWTECQGVAQFQVPAPDTQWVDERVAAESDPETSVLRCDPCRELWGQAHDGR